MSSIFQQKTGILYFDELESPAFAAVQSAWDRSRDGVGAKLVWTSFCKDMNELGYHRPTEKEMNRFLSAVERDEIPRPERTASSSVNDEEKQEVESVEVSAQPPAADANDLPVTTPVEERDDRVAAAFDHLHGLLVIEARVELERDLDKQARELATERLFSMAKRRAQEA